MHHLQSNLKIGALEAPKSPFRRGSSSIRCIPHIDWLFWGVQTHSEGCAEPRRLPAGSR